MRVTAVLVGLHRAFLPLDARAKGSVELRYEREAVTLGDVMRDLGVPSETESLVFLRGQPIQADRMLDDGDTVTFVSPVSGG